MSKSRLVWATGFLTVALGCLLHASARAGDAPQNPVLKKHGLKIAGSLAVADLESEIKTKLTEARRLSKQLSYSVMQQQGTMSATDLEKTIKTVTTQINQLRYEMNAVNQQMARVPRNTGRYGSRYGGASFVNTDAAELYAELLVYRNQLQMEITQDSYFLTQLRTHPPDPKARETIDAEVHDRRDAYHQALLDVRKLVDATTAKYAELGDDDEVKKALVAVGRGLREKPKLGPSRDFLTSVKLLEKMEAAEANGATDAAQGKPARRGRRGTRTRHSSKPAANAKGDSGGAR